MRRYRRRARSQYLLPFVALVIVGVVLVMIFQIWGIFFANSKGDAVYYTATGRSKVLAFGTSEWENMLSGSKVKLGDSVKTLKSGRGVVTFYDGTVMRLDENTQVTLLDISKKNDYQEILIYLNEGKIWVNKPKQNVIRKTDFVINTNYASYSITGTVFDLEKSVSEEVLHVVKGQVQTDIIETVDGKTRTIESMPVGIGQQTVLNETVMKAFYERQSPSVLGAFEADFEESEWYKWNEKEDLNPTNFAKGAVNSEVISDQQSTPDSGAVDSANVEADQANDKLPAPELVSPKTANMVLKKDSLTVSGKTVNGIKKLILRQTVAGNDQPEKILINDFDPKTLAFNYDLSEAKGNLKVGPNLYEFVGYDENAKETWPLKLEIEYQKANSSSDQKLEKPLVLTIDGKSYKEGMTIEKDGFAIAGSVNGASQVWVDDFKLNKFKAGDKTWAYNVKVSYGNLKPGLNTYQVYAVNEAGDKSSILIVKINYKPLVVEKPVLAVPAVTTSSSTGNGTTEQPASSVTTPAVVAPEKPINS
ncbi:FecR domain-containing protein [Candidatus Peregrinibacteria bacterium]|nr:FecR domain-containing protein [Candidatus Peregrinibacteria bacterium]